MLLWLDLFLLGLSLPTVSRCSPQSHSRQEPQFAFDKCPELPPYKSPPWIPGLPFGLPFDRYKLEQTSYGYARAILVSWGVTRYSCPKSVEEDITKPVHVKPVEIERVTRPVGVRPVQLKQNPTQPVPIGSEAWLFDAGPIVEYYRKAMGKTAWDVLDLLSTDKAYEMVLGRKRFPLVGRELGAAPKRNEPQIHGFILLTNDVDDAEFTANTTQSIPAPEGAARGRGPLHAKGTPKPVELKGRGYGSANWEKMKADGYGLGMEIYRVKTVGGKGPEVCSQETGGEFSVPTISQYYLFSPYGLFDKYGNNIILSSPKEWLCIPADD